MWTAKRLASQLGKRFQPMRTASLAAFTRALHELMAVRAAGGGSIAYARRIGQ
jgi:hypothetical protein